MGVPYIPYLSGAEASSESASGFPSHCCPGLQILRFLPKRQKHTHTEENDGGHYKETWGPLIPGTESLHNRPVPCKMKKPPAGPGLNYINIWPACCEWSNCNKVCWPQIILFFPCFVGRILILVIKSMVNIRQANPKMGDNFYIS